MHGGKDGVACVCHEPLVAQPSLLDDRRPSLGALELGLLQRLLVLRRRRLRVS